VSDTNVSIPGGSPTWEEILRAPAPTQHVAQFYAKADFLVRAISQYAEQGLRRGESVMLIARAAHGRAISHRLADEGLALDALVGRGQLRILDADRTLPQVLVDGAPDPGRFQAVVGRAVASAKAAGYPTVRVFGEMVDVLRRTSEAAALRLEALWNALLVEKRIALVCGYSVDTFDPGIYDGFLQGVLAAHSHLVPVEDYARLDLAVERAYGEVFGPGRDARYLRRAFLAHYVRPSALPDAQAAILAARAFVPASAGILLERVRHYYQGGAASAA
jgi:hypothetical protein